MMHDDRRLTRLLSQLQLAQHIHNTRRREPLEQERDHALAAGPIGAQRMKLVGACIKADHLRARLHPTPGAARHVALKAAAADRADLLTILKEQHPRSGSPITRPAQLDHGRQHTPLSIA
jgi:hypothetical protein